MDSHILHRFAKTGLGLLCFSLIAIMFLVDIPMMDIPIIEVRDAEARVGRPLTPASVGGVRRRTRRRTAAVVGAAAYGTRVHALPGGCVVRPVGSIQYHYCGGVYYRPYYEGSQVVYVVVEEPK